ncbi:MAG: T9SS type A sorting domain-containing protein [Bacteroidales bacterium]|nr:T9SS type A sorting domain-containing protein [Bacteroidales bacterium]
MTKKTLLAFLVATMMSATSLIAQDVLINEDFSLMTAGSEANPDGTNLAGSDYMIDPAYTHIPGWMGSDVFQAGGVCCLNNANSAFIGTPEMDMVGSLHISLRARMKNSSPNQTMMYVLLATNPYDPNVIAYNGSYINHDWAQYEFDIENHETGNAYLQIYCFAEWFVDDIVVTRELNFCPCPMVHEATNYTMDGFTASWKPVELADEYLLSVYKKEFNGPETVSYLEGFDGINHNGQWIDFMNPNYPEGWHINLDAGYERQVITGNGNCISEPTALCLDAEGDTLVIPTNGGRIIESNVYLKLLSFDESTDDADLLLYGINNGVWENLGYFFTDWAFYGNHGYDWNRTNIIDQMNTQQYEQIAIVYSGHGTIWALDDWDFTTTQPTTVEFIIEDMVVNDTVYDVTDLNPADDHYYFVKARNSQYTSEKSESVECFGLAAPTMHEATGITEDSYTANWERHPKADKYLVYNYYVHTAWSNETSHVVMHENFSKVTNSATPEDPYFLEEHGYCNLDEYTTAPDWWAYCGILANGMLGAGDDGQTLGTLHTQEMCLNNAPTFRVKVTMYGEEGMVVVFDASNDTQYTQFDQTGLQTFSLEFATGPESAHERLKIHALSSSNFLIDDILVTQDLAAGDQVFHLLGWRQPEGETESVTFDDLEHYYKTDYAYDIVAVHTAFGDDYKSEHSEMVFVEVPLNVNEDQDEQIAIYPNPASDKFVVAGDAETIELFDMTGRCVKSVQASAMLTSVSTATFADGIYLLKVTATDGSVTNQRIVVEH